MLYDGCLKQMRLARAALGEGGMETASNALMKAQDITSALMQGLDFRYPLSDNLLSLYEFIHYELVMTNVTKDPARITPIEEMVADLRATWEQAVRESRGQVRAAGDRPVAGNNHAAGIRLRWNGASAVYSR
jgi:flagellar protein FliS